MCIKPSGADTVANWDSNHTSFVELGGASDFFSGVSRCQAYSFSPRLLTRWQMGLGLFVPFSMCLCLLRGLTYFCRHGDLRALGRSPWIQSALLECNFELLDSKVCGEFLYLSIKHSPTFAELWGLWIILKQYLSLIPHMHGCSCLLSPRICLSSHNQIGFMLITFSKLFCFCS